MKDSPVDLLDTAIVAGNKAGMRRFIYWETYGGFPPPIHIPPEFNGEEAQKFWDANVAAFDALMNDHRSAAPIKRAPLVAGGQGRSERDILSTAELVVTFFWLAALAVVLGCLLAFFS